MSAFAVKHLVEDYGSLSIIMKDIKTTPYSYTSKEPEASEAKLGNDIYVIEVRVESKGIRSYWLGYKYRAYEKYLPAGGGRWKGRFKFKNAAKPYALAEGVFFDVPVKISDKNVDAWLREKRPGMAEIPKDLVAALDAIIANPSNGAKAFV